MVYVKHWHEFRAKALELYGRAPERARFLVKARPSTQMLDLKLTDDRETVKYHARSAIILNRLDAFQRELFEKMTGVPSAAEEPPAPAAQAAGKPNEAEAANKPNGEPSGRQGKGDAPAGKSKGKKKGRKK